jgi:hypothetical protein
VFSIMPQIQETADGVKERLTTLLELPRYEIPFYRVFERDFQKEMAKRCADADVYGPLMEAVLRTPLIGALTYPKNREILVSTQISQDPERLRLVLAKEWFRAWYAAHGAHAREFSEIGPDNLTVNDFRSYSDVVLGGAAFWKWTYACDSGSEEMFYRYIDGLNRQALDVSGSLTGKGKIDRHFLQQADQRHSHVLGFSAYQEIYKKEGVNGVNDAARTCRTNSELWQRAVI